MPRLLGPLVGLLLVVAPLSPVAASAVATPAPSVRSDEPCVTLAMKSRARHGMPKPRVHRIFGTSGVLVYRVVHNEEKRAYTMCDGRTLHVTYLRGKLGYERLAR
jgi:hypothetical protein